MVQKKYFYLIVSIFILTLFLSLTSALTGNSSQILYAENALGTFGSSENSTLSSSYASRMSGANIVGMYVFDEGFGRFGILGTTSAYCGNGVLELLEECDDGILNANTCGPACETTCSYCSLGCTTESETGATCGGSGDCFIAGTQILMANGNSKNIEDVKIGDLVKTVNTENMQIENNPVLELTSPIHNKMIILEFEDAINTNTFDHPYFIKNKGWASYKPALTLKRYKIKTNQLEIGDTAYFFDEGLKESKLLSIKEKITKTQTYNLHDVFENNNFFANGILVHNKGGGGGGGECTDECTNGSINSICKNNTVIATKICGNFDADSCSEWGDITLQTCLGGCIDGECSNQCIPDWQCEEWGECTGRTDANAVLRGGILLGDAHQERKCIDTNNCEQPATRTKSCTKYEPIGTRITEWCEEKYVELLEPQTNKVVGKIKQKEFLGISSIKRIDINFDTSEFSGYCDYCFDKVKNHDETDIDCGGPSCPECIKPKKYMDWIILVVILLWIMLLLLLILMTIEKRERIWEIWNMLKNLEEDVGRKFSSINFLKRKNITYGFQKTKIVSKEKLRRSWLKTSLLDIMKKKRVGFLGDEANISEARREIGRK